jgi:hypothetical protein
MALTSKKGARPTTKALNDDPDPVGFGRVFAEIYAKLEEAYHAQLRAFLRRNLLVGGLAPAVRRRIFAAVTARGRPVDADFRITFYPPDASGFFRADGALKTPVAELTAETEPDEESDAPERGPYITTLFGEKLPASRLKTRRGRFGRRR